MLKDIKEVLKHETETIEALNFCDAFAALYQVLNKKSRTMESTNDSTFLTKCPFCAKKIKCRKALEIKW